MELARKGLLRSASCMATAEYVEDGLQELLSFSDVGLYLHFNLTYGLALSAPDLSLPTHKRLMLQSLLGRINPEFVHEELTAQLGRLEQLGIPLKGLNGHHHVHLLPGIADVVIAQLGRSSYSELMLMLDVHHWPSYLQSRWFLKHQPNLALVKIKPCHYLRPRHLSSRDEMLRKISAAGGSPLLVHPALTDDFEASGVTDSLRAYRVFELKSILGHLRA